MSSPVDVKHHLLCENRHVQLQEEELRGQEEELRGLRAMRSGLGRLAQEFCPVDGVCFS